MTREEAIKQLKGMVMGAEWLSEYMVKALDMAIKALEQEPSVEIVNTEESNDNGTKYLNINVSDGEVKRNPDVVRLCSDVGVLEYVKPSGDLISRADAIEAIASRDITDGYEPVFSGRQVVALLNDLDSVNPQEPKILNTLDFAIDASNGETNYFVGFRNGLRYAKSLIDGEEEPQFESCTEQEPMYYPQVDGITPTVVAESEDKG